MKIYALIAAVEEYDDNYYYIANDELVDMYKSRDAADAECKRRMAQSLTVIFDNDFYAYSNIRSEIMDKVNDRSDDEDLIKWLESGDIYDGDDRMPKLLEIMGSNTDLYWIVEVELSGDTDTVYVVYERDTSFDGYIEGNKFHSIHATVEEMNIAKKMITSEYVTETINEPIDSLSSYDYIHYIRDHIIRGDDISHDEIVDRCINENTFTSHDMWTFDKGRRHRA